MTQTHTHRPFAGDFDQVPLPIPCATQASAAETSRTLHARNRVNAKVRPQLPRGHGPKVICEEVQRGTTPKATPGVPTSQGEEPSAMLHTSVQTLGISVEARTVSRHWSGMRRNGVRISAHMQTIS
jgi:hypothetical protein